MSKTKIAPALSTWIRSLRPGAIPDEVLRDVRNLKAVARDALAYKNRQGIILHDHGGPVREGRRLIDSLDRLSRLARPTLRKASHDER